MSALREQGLADARNQKFMELGYPPGPTKQACKQMNFRDITTYMKLHEEFGDIFMLPLGEVPLVVTRSPDHIRSLLGGAATETFPRPPNVIANIAILFDRAQIALDGAEHQANKRMLSDFLFSDSHNALMSFPLQRIGMDFLVRLEQDFHEHGNAEAYAISELAAADISAALSFGRTYRALQTGQCPQLDALKRCDKIFLNRAMDRNWRQNESAETTKEFNDSRQIIADTFMNAYERISGGQKVDYNVLSHMIERNLLNRDQAKCPMGHTPTPVEAISNMIGFLAGVGNTSRMIALGLEMSARYPEYQQLILEELHLVVDGKSPEQAKLAAKHNLALPGSRIPENFTYEKIMKLQFLRCFLMESLRLYTPSTSVAPRAATGPSEFGGYLIPKDTKVMCNIYGAHRHEGHWKNPLVFDPFRFNEGASNEVSDIKVRGFVEEGYFPFGYGGHSCIGKAIAMECTTICWAMVLGTHKITRTKGATDAVFNTLNSDQILGFIEPLNGVNVTLEQRPRDLALEAAAPQRILNESSLKLQEYTLRAESEKKKQSQVDVNRVITMEEVMQHTSRETGVWFVIEGKVYDATPWLRDHPGGADVLVRSAGKDVSRVFRLTNHSSFAVEEAANYQVGVLAPVSKI